MAMASNLTSVLFYLDSVMVTNIMYLDNTSVNSISQNWDNMMKRNINKDFWFCFDYFNHKTNRKTQQ